MTDGPRRVGRYEILREIGRGGMATVYLARQTDLNRHVALKELSVAHLAAPSAVERFLRESQTAGRLNHPNIVTLHDYFEDRGTPYISMEYMPRGSLRPFVADMTLAQVAGVFEGILAGLAHAETFHIVHRDLKPENVLLTTSGSVKIADFGIAKGVDNVSPSLTATGMTMGTPSYMAPEQALARDIGPWTDLYSAGVMAYEMLAGRLPFDGVDTPVAILMRHVNDPVPPPCQVKPDLDPQLCAWIERLLEKDPLRRPRRAKEAWHELEEIVIRVLGPRWRYDAPVMAAEVAHTPEVDAPDPTVAQPVVRETVDDGFRTYPAERPPPGPSITEAGPPPQVPPAPPPTVPPAEPAAPDLSPTIAEVAEVSLPAEPPKPAEPPAVAPPPGPPPPPPQIAETQPPAPPPAKPPPERTIVRTTRGKPRRRRLAKIGIPVLAVLAVLAAGVTWYESRGGGRASTTPVLVARTDVHASASSTLPDQFGQTYSADNTLDGRLCTAWNDSTPDEGVGGWLSYTFTPHTRIVRIDFLGGYVQSAHWFKDNERVASFSVTSNSGRTVQVRRIQQPYRWMTIFYDFGTVRSLKFTITDVYLGNHDQDLAVSEVRFWSVSPSARMPARYSRPRSRQTGPRSLIQTTCPRPSA
jgi:serine/threonine protein kinase